MDQTIKDIRAKGYSRTEFGRIRPFPDIATATGPQRQAAERQAMNSGIQGLAADIFKSALVRLDRQLRAEGLAGPTHPPGARRGRRRGPARGEGARRSRHPRRADQRRVAQCSPGGHAALGRELGRRQGRMTLRARLVSRVYTGDPIPIRLADPGVVCERSTHVGRHQPPLLPADGNL